MPLTVKETSGPQVPAGTHLAVCYGVCDIGTQPDTGFGEKRKLVIMWELPHERVTFDGQEKPMAISRFYGHSLSKKANLRKDLVGWRGREFTAEELQGFELKNVLGKPCQVSVVVNENGKSVVDSVVAMPKGMQAPPPFNPLVEYAVEEGRNATYLRLPDWLRKCIDQALENDPERQAEMKAAEMEKPADVTPDDVPF